MAGFCLVSVRSSLIASLPIVACDVSPIVTPVGVTIRTLLLLSGLKALRANDGASCALGATLVALATRVTFTEQHD